jgi:hypothetical protein
MFEGGAGAQHVLARVSRLAPLHPERYSDQQLLEVIELVEELGRHVDTMRLGLAHELDARSVGGPDEESLAHKLGHRGAAQALEMVARSSAMEAARRVKLSRRLGGFPQVRAALDAGEIGLEHADAITWPLAKALRVAAVDAVSVAETALVESARTQSVDLVSEQAKVWALRLDQDGVEPAFDEAMRRRFFTIGRVTDGLAKVSGLLPATHAAAVQSVLDAFVNPRAKVAFAAADDGRGTEADGTGTGGTGTGSLAAGDEPLLPHDRRTAAQKRADALRDICAAQARADQTPELGGDHPTVWISTTEAELAAGQGLAFLDGIAEAVPVAAAAQAACTGGVQELVFDENGDVLRLGRSHRGFTHRQRRALTLRDGNGCVIPGCTTPARWCEVHHVVNHRDGGRTDIGNGVQLCWFHHREIDTGPWRIRMVAGRPQLRWVYGSHASEWMPVRGDLAQAERLSATDTNRQAPLRRQP